MRTLNYISKSLTDFFDQHAQVNQVILADDFEFKAERNLVYPVVNVEFLDASLSNKYLNYNFKIVIGDLVSADDALKQHEVHSDMLGIAEDFFTFLQYHEGWEFVKSSSIQPFNEGGGDRVSGVVFRITLQVVRPQMECSTPTK